MITKILLVRSWCEHFAFFDSLMRKLQAHVSGEFSFSIYGRWEIRKQFNLLWYIFINKNMKFNTNCDGI